MNARASYGIIVASLRPFVSENKTGNIVGFCFRGKFVLFDGK
jgi:hypothetical protein